MATVYCIGEALIDFVPTEKGVRMEDVAAFIPNAGGGPANLAAAVSKLGTNAAFIGAVGDDAFGRLLRETLSGYGVDTANMITTNKAGTTLAFVALKADGDRDFIFYRNPGADMMLEEADIPEGLFKAGDILHFGSLGMVESPSKYAHLKAVKMVREAGGITSFDPNVRLNLWADPEDCKRTVHEMLPYSDIFKASLDEMPFIFDTDDEQTVANRCFEAGVKLVLITRGAKGSAIYTKEYTAEVASIDVKVEDTTGAGDSYNGAVLSQIVGKKLDDCLAPDSIDSIINLANVVGSITTMKKGGVSAIPTMEQVQQFREQHGL